MHYITLLVDKSALQALAPREAKWMFHHFRVNMPPVFFAEVIADLTKTKPRTSSAAGDVIALAKKIESYAVHVNAAANDLMREELMGRRFSVDGRIVDERTEVYTLPSGERAMFVDHTPTQNMLARWCNGDFSEHEKDFARVWRDGISKIKLEEVFRRVKAARRANISSSDEVIRLVDTVTTGRDFELMRNLYEMADLHPRVHAGAVDHWKREKHPKLSEFFPYSFFTLRIELYFILGLAHQVITTRDSNRIDIEYLKYLPFTQAFSSADSLHVDSARHFLGPHNSFIAGIDLKKSLAEIADIWDAVTEDTRKLGTANFANYPPPELDNAVTQLYDRYLPNWREGANKPRAPISPEHNAKIMAEIRTNMEAIEQQRKVNWRQGLGEGRD